MISVIKGGYIVAFNGVEHRILKDGVVVVEDDKIRDHCTIIQRMEYSQLRCLAQL